MPTVRVFRDPVHSNIQFGRSEDVGGLALRLIDSREVQRLRHIRQLALANLVYHGAEHSRFSHSLGVIHLAQRFYHAAVANSGQSPDKHSLAVVTASAALHDIGHPPFSHAIEKVIGIDHEDVGASLLREDTEVGRILRDFDGESFAEEVVSHIIGTTDSTTASIISSQLDADRMDYILRDGFHAGVPNSRFDIDRILQLATFDDTGVLFDSRATTAIEGYFIARYHLYVQLYYHKTARAAEVLLRSTLGRASVLAREGADLRVDDEVRRLLTGEPLSSARLTDHDLWSAFRLWADHDDRVLADLSSRLIERRLFKSIDLQDGAAGYDLKEKADALAESKGLDPHLYVVLDEAKDTPYKVVDVSAGDDPQVSVRIANGKGDIFALENRSPLIKQLRDNAYKNIRLFVASELRDELLK